MTQGKEGMKGGAIKDAIEDVQKMIHSADKFYWVKVEVERLEKVKRVLEASTTAEAEDKEGTVKRNCWVVFERDSEGGSGSTVVVCLNAHDANTYKQYDAQRRYVEVVPLSEPDSANASLDSIDRLIRKWVYTDSKDDQQWNAIRGKQSDLPDLPYSLETNVYAGRSALEEVPTLRVVLRKLPPVHLRRGSAQENRPIGSDAEKAAQKGENKG